MSKRQVIRLYTKGGDKGVSGLADGKRLTKSDPVFGSLGTVDELNSSLGWCAVVAKEKVRVEILEIQDILLKVGAIVAKSNKVRSEQKWITLLERRIDFYQLKTRKGWHKRFLLPGGIELAARLDLTRAICRRAERRIVSLDQKRLGKILVFMNRLSDYLFALRCWVNSKANYHERKFRPTYLGVADLSNY